MEPLERLVIIGAIISVFVVLSLVGLSYILIKGKHKYAYETIRMFFAGAALIEFGIIFMVALLAYYYSPQSDKGPEIGQNIFNACVTTIPPLITLVIGYYFGTARTNKNESDDIKEGE